MIDTPSRAGVVHTASYIKAMLNNTGIQSGAGINSWIAGIKFFQFESVHVLERLHTGPDGLSQHAISPNDPVEEDTVDYWLGQSSLPLF